MYSFVEIKEASESTKRPVEAFNERNEYHLLLFILCDLTKGTA